MNVIIPTWKAAATLPATVASLAEAGCPVIIADAGSPDGTADVARALGAQVIQAEKGRGAQLAAGAAAATADWLLFLHADTRLEAGWSQAAAAFMAGPPGAAYFTFGLDDDSPAARRLEAAVAWRCRNFSLPYGDQGLLIHRAVYRAAGGYRPLPLMEDVDFVRRLQPVALAPRAITSAEKWRRSGYLARSAKNLSILTLYFAGVPPRWLARIY